MSDRQTVYVAGYPKSGTVFITRLLGDALDCPTGAYWDSKDKEDIAAEGKYRKGPYIFRRGHFVLTDVEYADCFPPVPAPHKLAWKMIDNEKLLHVIRDPRDIAVSAYHYFNNDWNIATVLKNMRDGEGPFNVMGPWNSYVRSWIDLSLPVCTVKYEQLVKDSFGCIKQIVAELDLDVPADAYIMEACNRQEFTAKKKWLEKTSKQLNLGRHINLKHMRSGKAGSWKKEFSDKEKRMAQTFFGDTMIYLGYDI